MIFKILITMMLSFGCTTLSSEELRVLSAEETDKIINESIIPEQAVNPSKKSIEKKKKSNYKKAKVKKIGKKSKKRGTNGKAQSGM